MVLDYDVWFKIRPGRIEGYEPGLIEIPISLGRYPHLERDPWLGRIGELRVESPLGSSIKPILGLNRFEVPTVFVNAREKGVYTLGLALDCGTWCSSTDGYLFNSTPEESPGPIRGWAAVKIYAKAVWGVRERVRRSHYLGYPLEINVVRRDPVTICVEVVHEGKGLAGAEVAVYTPRGFNRYRTGMTGTCTFIYEGIGMYFIRVQLEKRNSILKATLSAWL